MGGALVINVGILALLATAGCVGEPIPNPESYREDFAGAPTPFVIYSQASDGQLAVHLERGHCRTIGMGAGRPPRVVNDYPCRYATGNVRVDFAFGNLGTFSGFTSLAGDIALVIPDQDVLNLGPRTIVTLVIGNQPVGQVALTPLWLAATGRIPAPVSASPPPAPYPQPASVTSPRADRLDNDTVTGLTLGVCALLLWGADKCEEVVGAKVGANAAAGACSAAAQFALEGDVAVRKIVTDMRDSYLARQNEFLNVLVKLNALSECYAEIRPRIAAGQ